MQIIKLSGSELDVVKIASDLTIRSGMAKMNASGLQVLAVISVEDGRFLGLVTDGDLRRGIANSIGLQDPVTQVINSSPFTIQADISKHQASVICDERDIRFLPLVVRQKLEALFICLPGLTNKSLTAVVMAGGLGSRLGDLTTHCPKPMIKIGGKPILEHIIEALFRDGVKTVYICVRYLAEQIIDYFGDGGAWGVRIQYIEEKERLGTGGALSLLPPDLPDTILCLNGDVLTDINFQKLRQEHLDNAYEATMGVINYSYSVPYGVVDSSSCGEYLGSREKPTLHFPINMGVYCLSRASLSVVPTAQFYDLPSLFEDLKTQDRKCGVYRHQGYWADVGTPEDLVRERKRFAPINPSSKR